MGHQLKVQVNCLNVIVTGDVLRVSVNAQVAGFTFLTNVQNVQIVLSDHHH